MAGWKEGEKQRFPLIKESISFWAAAAGFSWSSIPVEAKWGFLLPLPLKRRNTQPRQPSTQPNGDSLQRICSSFPMSWGSLLLDGWHQASGIRNYSTFCYVFIFSKRKLTPFLCCCTLWSLKCYSKKHGLSLLLTPVLYYCKKKKKLKMVPRW